MISAPVITSPGRCCSRKARAAAARDSSRLARDAEADHDSIQKRRNGQRHAERAEVRPGVKGEFEDAVGNPVAGKQRLAGASVGIGHGRGDRWRVPPRCGTVRRLRRRPVRRGTVQHVCGKPGHAISAGSAPDIHRAAAHRYRRRAVAGFGHGIPGSILRFQMHLRDFGNPASISGQADR